MDVSYSRRRSLENAVEMNSMELFNILFSQVHNQNKAYALAIKHQRKDMIELLEMFTDGDYDLPLLAAAETGKTKVVKSLVGKGKLNFIYALWGSAKGGHLDLFEYFLGKVDILEIDSDVMYYAALGRNREIIYRIEKLFPPERKNALGRTGIRGAAENNDKDLLDYFASYPGLSYNMALIGAVEGGHRELMDYCIKKGADVSRGTLEVAARNGDLVNIRMLIRRGAIDFDSGLIGATISGNITLIDFFLKLGATSDLCMDWAIRNQDDDLIIYLYEKGFKMGSQEVYWAERSTNKYITKLVKDRIRVDF